MKTRFLTCTTSIFLLIISCFTNASLLVSPTHIAFDTRERSKDIVLVNTSDSVKTYRIEWQQKKSLEQGGYEAINDDEDFPIASDMLRYSPRQVTLQPNERQVVKLALRKPKGLRAGEYRSHLTFRALPSPNKTAPMQTGFAIDLKLRMSYSLPVIVRQGENNLEIKAGSVSFTYIPDLKKGNIEVNFVRTGDYSSYGNIAAYWLPEGSTAEPTVIARLNGYSVYPELDKASANLIWVDADFTPTSGSLSIIYEGQGAYKGLVLEKNAFKISPLIEK